MARTATRRPGLGWRRPSAIRSAVLLLVALCSLGAGCGPLTGMLGASEEPNVILILTDDLDARLLQDHPDDYPNLRRLAAEGTTFENAFVTDPLCCPSRATILRGQYAHNHQIAGNWWPQGGARKFRKLGHEDSTVATWLQDQGYRTVLVGKYMNDYDGEHVPKGWDDWYAIVGSHLSEDLNENGRVRHYGSERHHLDDVLAEKAAGYLPRAARSDAPFFMWVGTQAPHAPATPAPRHEEAFQDARLPRGPSFDEEGVWDKPGWVRDNPRLRHKRVEPMQDLYRDRLRSMLAVDDMVGRLVDALESRGELDNTFIFFTSDNGWHAGEHRLTAGKWTAYEEDIRVPLIVRGPGVPEGETLPHLVLNNDLAPTFADLAGAAGEPGPPFVDGRSLAPLLDEDPPSEEDWRSAFLVEAAAEQGPSAVPPLSGDRLPKEWWRAPQEDSQEGSQQDWGRPRLKAVRTEDHIYVEYATGPRELYDLEKDPYQVNNRYYTADPELVRNLEERLAALRDCSGPDCRAAEDAP